MTFIRYLSPSSVVTVFTLLQLLSPTGVRGIRTIRTANPIDAQCERGAAERHVLRRHTEHGG